MGPSSRALIRADAPDPRACLEAAVGAVTTFALVDSAPPSHAPAPAPDPPPERPAEPAEPVDFDELRGALSERVAVMLEDGGAAPFDALIEAIFVALELFGDRIPRPRTPGPTSPRWRGSSPSGPRARPLPLPPNEELRP